MPVKPSSAKARTINRIDMNNRPIRIGTLVKLCGQPKLRASLCGEFPTSRIVTVHHAEMGGSLWGEVGAHPFNVFVYLILTPLTKPCSKP